MHPTDLTVAAIVCRDDEYLLVEEFAGGAAVLNQPGGHIEDGESPEDAVVREVLEETGCRISAGDLVGVYLWIQPQTRQQFLRIVFAGHYESCDPDRALDEGIIARLWLPRTELERRRKRLRTPMVLRSIADFEAGRRLADDVFAGFNPLARHVDQVIARADLV